jgi:hypothetical protein
MSMVQTVFSSAYYLTKWQEAETEYANAEDLEAVKYAGEGSSKVEFLSDKLKAIRDRIDYYKSKYEEAYKIENGGNKYSRLKTTMWGS